MPTKLRRVPTALLDFLQDRVVAQNDRWDNARDRPQRQFLPHSIVRPWHPNPDSKIDHPVFRYVAEIFRRFRKRFENRRSRILLPGFVIIIRRRHRHAELILLPLLEPLRVLRLEKYSADAVYFFHVIPISFLLMYWDGYLFRMMKI